MTFLAKELIDRSRSKRAILAGVEQLHQSAGGMRSKRASSRLRRRDVILRWSHADKALRLLDQNYVHSMDKLHFSWDPRGMVHMICDSWSPQVDLVLKPSSVWYLSQQFPSTFQPTASTNLPCRRSKLIPKSHREVWRILCSTNTLALDTNRGLSLGSILSFGSKHLPTLR